jgi:hypothetical protein
MCGKKNAPLFNATGLDPIRAYLHKDGDTGNGVLIPAGYAVIVPSGDAQTARKRKKPSERYLNRVGWILITLWYIYTTV